MCLTRYAAMLDRAQSGRCGPLENMVHYQLQRATGASQSTPPIPLAPLARGRSGLSQLTLREPNGRWLAPVGALRTRREHQRQSGWRFPIGRKGRLAISKPDIRW